MGLAPKPKTVHKTGVTPIPHVSAVHQRSFIVAKEENLTDQDRQDLALTMHVKAVQ